MPRRSGGKIAARRSARPRVRLPCARAAKSAALVFLSGCQASDQRNVVGE